TPYVGAAYVFARNGTAWSQQQVLIASDFVTDDRFGWSVGISGTTAVIGAEHSFRGAYAFVRQGATWAQVQQFQRRIGDIASSVAVSGGAVLVGSATNNAIDLDHGKGAVYVFLNSDSDGDGLPDDWERNGVTIDGKFINLPAMGANPLHKDLFVHADWMDPDPARRSVIFKPSAKAMKIVTDSF